MRTTRQRFAARLPLLLSLPALASCTGEISSSAGDLGGPGGGTEPGGGGPGAADMQGLPGPELAATSQLRRMTVDEYNRTMLWLLGDMTNAGQILPEDARKPFDNDYAHQGVDSALIGNVETLAGDVATRLLASTSRRDMVVGCVPRTATGADATGCLQQFITRFGRLAWRRTLTQEQVATLMTLGQAMSRQDNNFYSGVDAVVRAILQDPEFVFRVEVGTPVPGSTTLYKLTGPELAARLSFFLWGSAPDLQLLDLAERGGLDTPEKIRAQGAAMLGKAAALARVARFHALWMGYERLPVSPLAASMKLETDKLMERVIFEKKMPWQELLRHDETYVKYDLAVHYGITPPSTLKKGTNTAAWIPYTGTAAKKRQGLFSHATFLQMGVKTGDTHPVLRGKAIRELLFCQELAKPDNLDTSKPAMTPTSPCKREFLTAHASGACAGCHTRMDPVGFGLENYDGEGKYRASEYRSFLDATRKATIAAQAGAAGAVRCDISGDGVLDGQAFNGPAELANLMLAAPDLNACAVKQLYRFAMGRAALDATDHQFLALMGKRVGSKDFRFDELLLDFVSSGAFAHVRRD